MPALILDERRPRPALLHVGESRALLARIGEGQAGETAVAGDHDGGAERGGMKAVTQRHAGAACLPFAGRHRLVRHEQVMQPTGAGQAAVECRIQHAG